jgi:O-antigen/teichoic acid export membrane protein
MGKLLWLKTMRRFFSVAASSVLVVGLNMLATLYITRLLSPYEYGQWLYFLNWFGLFRLLLGLGLGPKIIKDLSGVRDNLRELNRRFWNVMTVRGFMIMGALIVILITLFFSPPWFKVQGSSEYRGAVPRIAGVAAMVAVLAVLADSTLSTTAGLRQVTAHNLVLVAQPLIYIGGIAVVNFVRRYRYGWEDVWLWSRSVWGIAGLYGLSYILAFLIGVVLVWRTGLLCLKLWPGSAGRSADTLGQTASLHVSGSLRPIRALRFAGAMYGVAILTYLFSVVGTMWLGTRQHYDLTAAFGVPFNLVMLPGSIAQTAIVSTFYPALCALLEQSEPRRSGQWVSARTLVLRFTQCVVGAAVIACLILALYPRPILRIIYSEKYINAAEILTLLSPMVVLVPVELLIVYTYAALGKLAKPLLGYGAQVAALLIIGSIGIDRAILPGDLERGLAVVYLIVKIFGVVGLGIGLYQEFSMVKRSQVGI